MPSLLTDCDRFFLGIIHPGDRDLLDSWLALCSKLFDGSFNFCFITLNRIVLRCLIFDNPARGSFLKELFSMVGSAARWRLTVCEFKSVNPCFRNSEYCRWCSRFGSSFLSDGTLSFLYFSILVRTSRTTSSTLCALSLPILLSFDDKSFKRHHTLIEFFDSYRIACAPVSWIAQIEADYWYFFVSRGYLVWEFVALVMAAKARRGWPLWRGGRIRLNGPPAPSKELRSWNGILHAWSESLSILGSTFVRSTTKRHQLQAWTWMIQARNER